ncbi:MAG: aminotransferase class V-fold PLP-dependent enzyme [Bacteroidales bacterium]|nr:aminotransferase class V-fold PLP-dependent enzyme [Bacteroidales bacterium]
MSIYLDNAATSHPKPEAVYRAVDQTLRQVGANPGRGGHAMGLEAGRLLFEARETLADFFGIADSSRIAFTANATEAINLALFGLLKAGDRVVTSTMEHNAVLRPLRVLRERGVEVVQVSADRQGFIDPQVVRAACGKPTRMVVLSHCSNVSGTLQPVEEIGPWCREQGILFFLDAAQSAGVFPVKVDELGVDLLAVPGHKSLMGPQGTGFLYVRPELRLAPLIHGGTGGHSNAEVMPEEMPERCEAGTRNTPGIAGLKAAVDFLREMGLERIRAHEKALLGRLLDGLSRLSKVAIHGPRDLDRHGGACSFTLDGIDPAQVGFWLDHAYGIVCRVGLHCAPDAHRTLGTHPRGTVRVSPGYFTTAGEIDALLAALAELPGRIAAGGGS